MRNFFIGVRKHIGKLDVQHLREQYEILSDELARSDMLLHALREGLVRLDENGKMIQCNPAARTLLGMAPDDILPELGLPLGKSSKREIAITYPEARTLEIQTLPFGTETLTIIRDITAEKQRSEEELRVGATEAVKNLASGVAHEIGNPLNALSLNLQLLQREHPDDESIAECRAQIARLDGILRGFLQALRPTRPNLVPGSVAEPLKSCLSTLRQQFEDRKISVSLDMPSALPVCAIDAEKLEQVFFNLLKNALEAVRDSGKIAITIDSDDNDVKVTLHDSGIGMSTEQLAHLFEPYRTSKDHGNGLGLMISQRIVHDHGGMIDVESKQGAGTAFTVRIPRIEKRIRVLK